MLTHLPDIRKMVALACIVGLAGCSGLPIVDTVEVTDTIPKEISLVELREVLSVDRPVTINELIEAAKELAALRARTAADAARLQQELNNSRAQQQAQIIEDAKDGKIRRAILWALGILAGLAVFAGAVLGWMTKSIAVGGAVVAGGTLLLLVVLNAGDKWVTAIVRVGIGGCVALMLVAAAIWLWGIAHGKEVKRQEINEATNEQAGKKLDRAAQTTDPAEKATLVTEAHLLKHMGSPEQDASHTEPSKAGVAMVNAAMGKGAKLVAAAVESARIDEPVTVTPSVAAPSAVDVVDVQPTTEPAPAKPKAPVITGGS